MFSGLSEAIANLKHFNGTAADFYSSWWSGDGHEDVNASVENSFHDAVPARILKSPDGRFIFSLGFKAVEVEPGEFLKLDDLNSLIIRRLTWSSEYWNWYQTSMPKTAFSKSKFIRLYIPSSESSSTRLVRTLHSQVEELALPAVMKNRRSNGVFRDSIVCWIEERHLAEVIGAFRQTLEVESFLVDPPPLSKKYLGIGFCEHPSSGDSVGWLYSNLLWGLAKSETDINLEDLFFEKNLNINKPWILDASIESASWEKIFE